MKFNISYIFMVFFIYSVLGFISETIFTSIKNKKFVNRGFLFGPYCPVYGFGSLFIIYCLSRYENDPIVVFILGSVITSCLEYFTSFILEKIFHNKWWDYSDYKYNVNGRICLQNTILFGLGSLVIIYLGDPLIFKFLNRLSNFSLNLNALIYGFIFIVDTIYSFIIAYNLRNKLIFCEELKKEKLAHLPGMLEKIMKERLSNLKTYPKRLLEAFPNLKNNNFKEFEIMKAIREKNILEKKKQKKNKAKKKKVNK